MRTISIKLMTMTLLSISFCVLCLLFTTRSYAQTIPTPIPVPSVTIPTTSPPSPTSSSTDTEVTVLKTQLETMRDYEQQLTSMVQWSLGIVGAVVVALVSFSWYVNFRVYERDKERLAEELRASIWLSVNKEVERALKDKLRDVKLQMDNIERSYMDIKLETLESEAQEWTNKKIFENSVRTYTNLIGLAMKDKREFLIGTSLDSVKQILKYNIYFVSPLTVLNLTKVLTDLPPMYLVEVEIIKDMLKNRQSSDEYFARLMKDAEVTVKDENKLSQDSNNDNNKTEGVKQDSN